MFSRSHNSKNSSKPGGGGALTSHLFHRRLLAKPTSHRSPDRHDSQSVRETPDVPATGGCAGAVLQRQDAYFDRSPVQLVSIRRVTEESTTSPTGSIEGGGPHGRRTKLGLSVAVVRGPGTMNNSSASATSSLSAEVDLGQTDLDCRNFSDTSVSPVSSNADNDVERTKETGKYSVLGSLVSSLIRLAGCSCPASSSIFTARCTLVQLQSAVGLLRLRDVRQSVCLSVEDLQEFTNALSNGTIADPLRPLVQGSHASWKVMEK